MKAMNRLGKWLGFGTVLTALATSGSGCLTRPVGQQPPTTKVNFTSTISQQAVDKVDLLFMIDNSASMGDKQDILSQAVPNLIQGLLNPQCVDSNSGAPVGKTADPNGGKSNNFNCPQGSEPEFEPVTDMHIGIISSSLGSFGGDVCPDATPRFNDHGHLLALQKGGGTVAAAQPGSFLSWFPQNEANNDATRHPPPANPTRDINALNTAFQTMVTGVEQNGCGLEAQLESIYHFLIQPDPWKEIKLDANNQADLGTVANGDIDMDLLAQRADFLRADSLVAIIALTDEDDSSPDPLSVGGQGWAFSARNFPGSKVFRGQAANGTTAPRGTSACTDPSRGPGSPDCTSCGFQSLCNASDPACQKIKNDPNCQALGSPPASGDSNDGYAGYYGPDDDDLNVRYHRMKERFGIDPQYPLQRYIDGFTKFKVPDRDTEHPTKVDGGRRSIAAYTNNPKCTNPLFAKTLPKAPGDEICNLPRSTRSPDLIFFAIVGGVPNQLLHFKAGDAEGSRLNDDDWTKILGRRPEDYDYTGIDPHMIQSVAPRQGLEAPSATRGDNGSDPIHGREWDTKKGDLQYACTFPLPAPRTCNDKDPSCDCANADKNPPLCAASLTTDNQVKAKAYPTVRELMLAHSLGDNGIAASLCPIQLTNKDAPDYGYKPAVAAIIDRLKNALTVQCLPQKLIEDGQPFGQVPCLVLAQLGEATDTCDKYGLTVPPPDILSVFLEQQKAEQGNVSTPGAVDLTKYPVCVVPQSKNVNQPGDDCKAQTDIEWCYVENGNGKTPAGRCPQALLFSTGSEQMQGARFFLQCIKQFSQTDKDQTQQPAQP